jgi:hypothetical protein
MHRAPIALALITKILILAPSVPTAITATIASISMIRARIILIPAGVAVIGASRLGAETINDRLASSTDARGLRVTAAIVVASGSGA